MPLFSIIIPAYNEEKAICEVLDTLEQAKEVITSGVDNLKDIKNIGVEIIVVNDGSKDMTSQLVSKYNDVSLINHPRNLGYGRALKTGFHRAKGDWIGFLDADGSYPPESIYLLFRKLIEYKVDIVWGSRLLQGRGEMPLLRWVANLFLTWLTNKIFGSKLTDVTSGMRVFRKELSARFYSLPYGLEFSPAMSSLALRQGMRIKEIPIPYKQRIGQSKIRLLRDGIKFLIAILACKMGLIV